MKVFAFDTETYPIKPGLQAPPVVCGQYSHGGRVSVALAEDFRDVFQGALQDSNTLIVGHNVAYDMGVCGATWPDLLPLIFEAYADDRVTCTQIREKLIRIAEGTSFRYRSHSLIGLTDRYKIDHAYNVNTASGQKEEYWRTRYSELRNTPVAEWPEDAVRYAREDARVTRAVFEAQESSPQWLKDQYRQTRAAWWLRLMSCRGLRIDQRQARSYRQQVEAEHVVIEAWLQSCELLRADGSKDTKLAKSLVQAAFKAKGLSVPLTPKGKQLSKDGTPTELKHVSTDVDACSVSGVPELAAFARFGSLTTLKGRVDRLIAAGDLPIQPRYDSLKETGRTSASAGVTKPGRTVMAYGDQIQNLPREEGLRECYVPRDGYLIAAVDWAAAELHTLSQACIHLGLDSNLARVLNSGKDVHMWFGAETQGWSYEWAQEARKGLHGSEAKASAKDFRQMAKCFHGDVEVLTRTGWTRLRDLQEGVKIAVPRVSDRHGVTVEWEAPSRLTHRPDQPLVHLRNEGIDLRVTADHRMVGWDQAGGRRTVAAQDVAKLRHWPNAGTLKGGLEQDLDILRLAVAIQADGNLHGHRVRFGFTKQRKIRRLEKICQVLNVDLVWKRYEPKNPAHNTQFHTTLEGPIVREALLHLDSKQLSWEMLGYSVEARQLILDEARFWDGSTPARGVCYQYSSEKAQDREVLQALASITGRKSRQRGSRVTIRNNAKSRGGNVSVQKLPGLHEVFCLTTSTDCVLVRDGGTPVITHQCANFGFPGGLGIEKFRLFALKTYGVDLSEGEARELKSMWFAAFPEMEEYFRLINDLIESGQPLRQAGPSGRYRGSVTYCSACNSHFQGLAADMGKTAGFELARGCYVYGYNPPLWGSFPVAFIHDEFLVEVPETRAHEAAMAIVEVMEGAGSEWCPDVPVRAEPALMRRWRKAADPVWVDGRLVPWEDRAQ